MSDLVGFEIVSHGPEGSGIVIRLTEGCVAAMTEQPSDLPGLVVMVDTQVPNTPVAKIQCSTHSTPPTLPLYQSVVGRRCKTVLSQLVLAVLLLVIKAFTFSHLVRCHVDILPHR